MAVEQALRRSELGACSKKIEGAESKKQNNKMQRNKGKHLIAC
jgi:hypothetical protein